MQREEPLKTKITIREDYPVSVASTWNGANVGGMAFNTEFIALRNPLMAVKLCKLWEEAKALKDAPLLDNNNEDFVKARELFIKMMTRSSDGKDSN